MWKKNQWLFLVPSIGGRYHIITQLSGFEKRTIFVLVLHHFFIVHPWKLTCPLKINGWKMYFLLRWSLFGGHVNFQGCISTGQACCFSNDTPPVVISRESSHKATTKGSRNEPFVRIFSWNPRTGLGRARNFLPQMGLHGPGWWFQIFLEFWSLPGEMIQFD